MKKIKTLVIDDEHLNRDVITKLVHKLDANFEIIADADNIDDAYELIAKHSPDLVFLDIKMPGGNGFDLLKRFTNPEFEVVFITGFDEYALQAFEFNALDYVLKPIDSVKLKNTLDKVYNRITSKLSITNNLKEILSVYNSEDYLISKIPIHHRDKVELINIKEILSLTAYEGYTMFKMLCNSEYISSKQFSSFEFIINKFPNFIKINKGTYVNLNFLKNYTKGDTCFIELTNNLSYEVSRRKKTEILVVLEKGI